MRLSTLNVTAIHSSKLCTRDASPTVGGVSLEYHPLLLSRALVITGVQTVLLQQSPKPSMEETQELDKQLPLTGDLLRKRPHRMEADQMAMAMAMAAAAAEAAAEV